MSDVIDKVADTGAADTAAGKTDAPIVDAKAAGAVDAGKAADTTTGDKSAAVDALKAAVGATDAGADKSKSDATPTIPDNWRELAADGDESILKEIARYGSLKGVAKALVEAKAMIRSGKVTRAQPDVADAKAMAEWRKEQGIPEEASGYKIPEIKGHEWSDADKPVIASYFELAHAKGLPQAVLDANLEIYAKLQQDAQEQQHNFDVKQRQDAEDALRKDWAGGEYRQNMSLAKAWLERSGIGPDWAGARLPDGRTLASMPEFIRWASDMGRQNLDETTINGDAQAKATTRQAELREMQIKDPDKYWSKEIQAEERALIERELASKSAKR